MAFTYKGYAGKYLRVDLTRGKTLELELPKEWARGYIGGSGMGARILYDEVPRNVGPLSPDNILIFATGPVTGTAYPPSGRYCVVTKAPLTGIWGEAHSGGYWGPELKYAGYDLIIIRGRAPRPMYLFIEDGKVELRGAKRLWGKNTAETTDAIEGELGRDVRVACIGMAGERLVKFACIINERSRAAGRTGVGAVMGSKRLKAVVVRGSGSIEVANFDRVWELTKEAHERYTGGEWGKASHDALYRFGTPGLVSWENEIGRLPTKGHRTGVFDRAADIGPEVFEREFIIHRRSCMNCRIQCKKVARVGRSGPYAGLITEGPEYETIVALGSNCLVSNFPAVMQVNQLCNLHGMDTISCGGAVSFAMECFERGALSERDIGFALGWGDGDAMVRLVGMMASREGVGDVLAEGIRAAAKRIGKGSGRWAIQVKGLEASGQDGRAHQSVGLTHAISVIGAAHLRALSSLDELDYRKTITERYGKARAAALGDRLSTKYKGMLVKDVEDLYAVVDALITCKYGTMWPPIFYFEDYAEILPAVTGVEEFGSVKELRIIAERIVNLKRAFNARLGLGRKDDTLPERMLKEPMPEGPAKGRVVDLKPMLDEYYRERGWDVRTGLQRRATLERFGLADVARDLKRVGALAK